ncbi:DUF4129 domain-containing protein [Natrinema ejinorense]|uniref:Protein-glutamine gamma-glutamyltransferase-like C-terminal domain-containing protein n=1 Tax=Natrinema ejinorense TaxID=373386 RepID=A0A2A5QV35_9EURY|nr:DUF4129 domain-containing protein [Natrinema ejinorense]PCR90706.1 hypothetical protein CP557_09405 [Natrinema ejinorense]
MRPRQHRLLIVAAVCVLALSLAAATLDSTVDPAPGGGGTGDGASPSPVSNGDRPGVSPGPPCVSWLATPWATMGLLGALGGGSLLVWHRYSRLEAIAVGAGVGGPALGLYLVLTDCATGGAATIVYRQFDRLPLGRVGDSASGSGPVVPAVLLGAVLLAGLALAAISFSVSLVDRGAASASPVEADDDSDGAAAARAAGDAAERLEGSAGFETEIHRAWREMAVHLDVPSPESSTPGEFADAAIEAGLNPDAVRELTARFEEVRYGGFDATADRETRARNALERIEASFQSVGEGPTTADDSDGVPPNGGN